MAESLLKNFNVRLSVADLKKLDEIASQEEESKICILRRLLRQEHKQLFGERSATVTSTIRSNLMRKSK